MTSCLLPGKLPSHFIILNLYFRAGGEDDFEKFLAGVKARSLRNTAHLRKSKVTFHHKTFLSENLDVILCKDYKYLSWV